MIAVCRDMPGHLSGHGKTGKNFGTLQVDGKNCVYWCIMWGQLRAPIIIIMLIWVAIINCLKLCWIFEPFRKVQRHELTFGTCRDIASPDGIKCRKNPSNITWLWALIKPLRHHVMRLFVKLASLGASWGTNWEPSPKNPLWHHNTMIQRVYRGFHYLFNSNSTAYNCFGLLLLIKNIQQKTDNHE